MIAREKVGGFEGEKHTTRQTILGFCRISGLSAKTEISSKNARVYVYVFFSI